MSWAATSLAAERASAPFVACSRSGPAARGGRWRSTAEVAVAQRLTARPLVQAVSRGAWPVCGGHVDIVLILFPLYDVRSFTPTRKRHKGVMQRSQLLCHQRGRQCRADWTMPAATDRSRHPSSSYDYIGAAGVSLRPPPGHGLVTARPPGPPPRLSPAASPSMPRRRG